jgi:hypothetical protein
MVPSDTLAPLLGRLAESVAKQRANTPQLIPPRPDQLPADVQAERAAWDEVLWWVREAFPEALLCGGAIRNYLLGLPVKDYDVFVTWRGTLAEAAEAWLAAYPDLRIGVDYKALRLARAEPKRAELVGAIILTNLPGVPRPVEIVLVRGGVPDAALTDLHAGVLPLNFGIYYTNPFRQNKQHLPEALTQDLERREITVLLDRLPMQDPEAVAAWVKRVVKLQTLTGWPLVYR